MSSADRNDPEYWEAILEAEGMPAELPVKRDKGGHRREVPFPTYFDNAIFLGDIKPIVAPTGEPWVSDLIGQMIEDLPEVMRDCVELSLYGRMSLRRIESEIGLAKSAVARLIHEARRILKARLLQHPKMREKLYGESGLGKARGRNCLVECRAGTCERDDCPKCHCIPGSLAEVYIRQEERDHLQLLDDARPGGS